MARKTNLNEVILNSPELAQKIQKCIRDSGISKRKLSEMMNITAAEICRITNLQAVIIQKKYIRQLETILKVSILPEENSNSTSSSSDNSIIIKQKDLINSLTEENMRLREEIKSLRTLLTSKWEKGA